ncbi:hypothetical protein [Pontibacter harenae]|uniref:hypothetical protein n=1 Tax=Pontibacter harenae TaxID=2894083 RepID=UPI001E5687C6|nr:hypothetical protein [Pontibacter harenae]MCC9168472.1 hypothetical protein [Pontibacter harenae]
MNKIYTSNYSNLYFLITGLLLLISSCTPRVEANKDQSQEATAVVSPAVKPEPVVTVLSIEKPTEEVYFDLVANTSNCLGETLWIGGKAQSGEEAVLDDKGVLKPNTVFEVKELTATGIETNNSYTLDNAKGTLKAVYDKNGVLQIQLGDGPLQLIPRSGNARTITVAHQAIPADMGYVGHWTCK